MDDFTGKYIGEQVELWLFGGEQQEGRLTALCLVADVPHVELDGHILVPLQNVSGMHCVTRCEHPGEDWPPSLGNDLDELDS